MIARVFAGVSAGRVVVAALVLIGFYGVLAALFFSAGMSDAIADLLKIMIGTLAACLVAVVQYYFGSSDDSKAKDDLHREMLLGRRAAEDPKRDGGAP